MELLTWVIGAAVVFAAPLAIVTAVHFVARMRWRSAQMRLKAGLAASTAAAGATAHERVPRAEVAAAGSGGGALVQPSGGRLADPQKEWRAGGYARKMGDMEPATLQHG